MSIDLDHKLSVLAAAEEVPDAVAVRSNGDCLMYRELAKKVRDILPRLGDARPYPLVARPDLETLIKVFALLERKQPILLLHPGLTEHERNTLLSSVEGLDHHLPEDTAVILFTSGTTGLPKPAILTREALTASAEASRQHSSESRRCLAAVDFTRTYRRLLHSDAVFDRKIGNCARAEVFSERIPAPSGG